MIGEGDLKHISYNGGRYIHIAQSVVKLVGKI